MWFIDTMEYYVAMRKNEIVPFAATWMDNKPGRKRQIPCVFTCMCILRNLKRTMGEGQGEKKDTEREGGKP